MRQNKRVAKLWAQRKCVKMSHFDFFSYLKKKLARFLLHYSVIPVALEGAV